VGTQDRAYIYRHKSNGPRKNLGTWSNVDFNFLLNVGT
jgi:hypothetical protein